MRRSQNQRANYHRMRSRHGRLGLGYHRYEALARNSETIAFGSNRFEARAMELFSRSSKHLWEANPSSFWQSPRLPVPEQRGNRWH